MNFGFPGVTDKDRILTRRQMLSSNREANLSSGVLYWISWQKMVQFALSDMTLLLLNVRIFEICEL